MQFQFLRAAFRQKAQHRPFADDIRIAYAHPGEMIAGISLVRAVVDQRIRQIGQTVARSKKLIDKIMIFRNLKGRVKEDFPLPQGAFAEHHRGHPKGQLEQYFARDAGMGSRRLPGLHLAEAAVGGTD